MGKTKKATVEPQSAPVTQAQEKVRPTFSIIVNGDTFICPHADEVTVDDMDGFVTFRRSLTFPAMPREISKRSLRNQRKWAREQDFKLQVKAASYWWGLIDKQMHTAFSSQKELDAYLGAAINAMNPPYVASKTFVSNGVTYHLRTDLIENRGVKIPIGNIAELISAFIRTADDQPVTYEAAQKMLLIEVRPVLEWLRMAGSAILAPIGADIIDKILYKRE